MAKFASFIKRGLTTGDTLAIDSIPGEGTLVTLNKVALGKIDSEDFFTILLPAWIGSVPLSSDFRTALLSGGNIEQKLINRYQSLTPTPGRVKAVKAWYGRSNQTISENLENHSESGGGTELQNDDGAPQNVVAGKAQKQLQGGSVAANKSVAPTIESNLKAIDKQLKTNTLKAVNEPLKAVNKPLKAVNKPLKAVEEKLQNPVGSESQGAQVKNEGDKGSDQPAHIGASSVETLPQLAFIEPQTQVEFQDGEFDSQRFENEPVTYTAEGLLSRQRYQSKLLRWAYKHVKYPVRAQNRKQEGSVRMSVVIDRKGNIKDISMVQASRYAMLNKEARGSLKRASPFPPVPEELSGEEFTFYLPIVFKM